MTVAAVVSTSLFELVADSSDPGSVLDASTAVSDVRAATTDDVKAGISIPVEVGCTAAREVLVVAEDADGTCTLSGVDVVLGRADMASGSTVVTEDTTMELSSSAGPDEVASGSIDCEEVLREGLASSELCGLDSPIVDVVEASPIELSIDFSVVWSATAVVVTGEATRFDVASSTETDRIEEVSASTLDVVAAIVAESTGKLDESAETVLNRSELVVATIRVVSEDTTTVEGVELNAGSEDKESVSAS